jgi:hypothetical protein
MNLHLYPYLPLLNLPRIRDTTFKLLEKINYPHDLLTVSTVTVIEQNFNEHLYLLTQSPRKIRTSETQSYLYFIVYLTDLLFIELFAYTFPSVFNILMCLCQCPSKTSNSVKSSLITQWEIYIFLSLLIHFLSFFLLLVLSRVCFVAQPGLELKILLTHSPVDWNYRYATPFPAFFLFSLHISFFFLLPYNTFSS